MPLLIIETGLAWDVGAVDLEFNGIVESNTGAEQPLFDDVAYGAEFLVVSEFGLF